MAHGSKYVVGKMEKEVLRSVANGLNSITDFLLTQLLEARKNKHSQKYSLKKTLKNMESKGFISLSEDVIKLSKTGLAILRSMEIEDIKIKKTGWDGIWRVVSYDIPEKQKAQRRILREKLKSEGFVKLQKSMWVFPYECKEEIAIISQKLGISSYIIYLLTDKLPNQSKLTSKFNFKSNKL